MRLRNFLLVLALLGASAAKAEPLVPLLAPQEAARLRTQLWHTPSGAARLRLLLRLSTDLLARHEEVETPLDSAGAYGQQALALSTQLGDLTSRIRSLYVLGQLPGPGGAADTTNWVRLRQGLVLSQQAGNRALEATGWFYLASGYPRTKAGLPRKLASYAHAAALFEQARQPLAHAYVLKTMADMHLLQGQSGQAEQELLHVLALYRTAGHRELHYTYDLLRGATRQVGNYQAALRYGLAAIESAQATHDTTSLDYFYASVAGIYNELHQPQQALSYYQRALHYARQAQSPVAVVSAAGAISRILLSQHQPQQALHFLQATAGSSQAASPDTYARYLIECYVALGRYPAAERSLGPLLARAAQPGVSDMESKTPDPRTPWTTPEVGANVATKGFHTVTLTLASIKATADILTEVFGYTLLEQHVNRYRYVTDTVPGGAQYIDLVEVPGEARAITAGGSVHHIAFRVKDDADELFFRQKLIARGPQPTPQIDRDYFHSVYFREPGGVLFELATENPGFTVDEPLAELGTHLMLPTQHEHLRAQLEQRLPKVG